MRKPISITMILFSLVGCATSRESGDFELQYSSTSSRLTVAEGLPSLPGNGTYLAIPGYIFVAEQMSLHPGIHRISYACPGDWDWQKITHYIPSVEQEFEIGKWYELYCQDGYPLIRQTKNLDEPEHK